MPEPGPIAQEDAAGHAYRYGLVVVGAAVAQAAFHTSEKPLLRRYTSLEVTVYSMWAGTIFILPWTGSLLHALPHASGRAIASAAFLGIAPSATGFVLWGYAMARMDVGRVTTTLYLVPAVAIIISFVWLGQRPGVIELVGGGIALSGVLLASTRPRSRSRASTRVSAE